MCSDMLWAGWSRDQILVRVRFSVSDQTGPETHPASCAGGTESFLGGKVAGM